MALGWFVLLIPEELSEAGILKVGLGGGLSFPLAKSRSGTENYVGCHL